jgi:hypothetical protein
MKTIAKILVIVCMASAFEACNSDAKMQAYKNSKRIQDSLKLDSFKRAEVANKERAEELEREKAEIRNNARSSSRVSSSSSQSYGYVEQQPAVQQKKGMSSAAKGAIIGAGAGAVTGILVDKKDGRGAVIGGVVGAGTGYVIGRSKDKKSGRVQK